MFPSALPSLTNPTSGTSPATLSHAQQHADANDNIEALCAKLGIGAATPVANRLLTGTGVGTSDWSKVTPNGTIVGTTDTQTLTNKTLTSPTINTPTIVNPTLQTDVVSEYTGANGVTVDGLNIKDGALNTANSVPNSTLSNTGAFGSAWAWTAWTPTWTNLTVGNAVQAFKYTQIGKTVFMRGYLTFGTTTVMGTSPTISLPVTAKDTNRGTASGNAGYGTVRFEDNGTASLEGVLFLATTNTSTLIVYNAGGTYLTAASVTSAIPFAWASGDEIRITASYEAA